MFPDTVTIYNKFTEAGIEKWQRTVISGVFWSSIKGATMRKTGVQSVDSVQLIIPMTANAARASYQEPLAWSASANKADSWTLQSGDVVLLGSIDTEILKSTKELQGYDSRLVITSVDTKHFGGGMAHWEVSGK